MKRKPKYTKNQLDILAERMKSIGYKGLATSIRWVNSLSMKIYPEYEQILFNVYYEDLPLYINYNDKAVVEIAKWRLELNK